MLVHECLRAVGLARPDGFIDQPVPIRRFPMIALGCAPGGLAVQT